VSASGAVEALWSLELPDAFIVRNYEGAHAAFYDQMSQRSDGGLRACLDRIVPGERVLDLGCGSGRLTTRLASLGHEVTGVDAAQEMLARAQARLDRHGTSARLEVGDIRGWADSEPYDVVTLIGLTFSLFAEPADRLDVWRTAARNTRPGGRVLLDFLPLDGVVDSLQHWAVGVRLGPMRGRTLIEVRRDVAARTQIADLYTQLTRTDRRCVHLRSTTTSVLVMEREVLDAAAACGLHQVERNADSTPYEMGRLVELIRREPATDRTLTGEDST
jgi:2-polyprenyl-3-methyl-5-hydroxy-6-metoxy-1,4-benzoquinol methylase